MNRLTIKQVTTCVNSATRVTKESVAIDYDTLTQALNAAPRLRSYWAAGSAPGPMVRYMSAHCGNQPRKRQDAEAKVLNERLTNLYAAQSDIETLTKAEEVGRGGGATGGKIGSTLLGKAEREVGRALPGASAMAKSPAIKAATGAADSVEWVRVQDSNGSQWDVHPSDLRRMQSADPGVQLVTPN